MKASTLSKQVVLLSIKQICDTFTFSLFGLIFGGFISHEPFTIHQNNEGRTMAKLKGIKVTLSYLGSFEFLLHGVRHFQVTRSWLCVTEISCSLIACGLKTHPGIQSHCNALSQSLHGSPPPGIVSCSFYKYVVQQYSVGFVLVLFVKFDTAFSGI